MVSGKGTACDVGTDHAYLAAYLVQSGKCKNVIASDINDGPLKAAAQTVKKLELSAQIRLVKTNGLELIPPDGITDVILAGMGAETICEIIGKTEWLSENINIVIQPMTKIPFLRRWLYRNKFEILKETAVIDDKFTYTVMQVRYSGYAIEINELVENAGRLDYSLDDSKIYAQKQYERVYGVLQGLRKSGRLNQDMIRLAALSDTLKSVSDGGYKVFVKDIYEEINRIAPFSLQESWDNSGLLVGGMYSEVRKILLSLDITNDVVDEAIEKGADLIVSHHPVIFDSLKVLDANNPAVRLAMNGISAICSHTPLDIADGGINDIIFDMLKEPLSLYDMKTPLEITDAEGNVGLGRVCVTHVDLNAKHIAKVLKEIFGCSVVRYTDTAAPIENIAICAGSGGSLLEKVLEQEISAFITSDIKHDVWINARNNDVALFDCGHFYTENVVLKYLEKVLRANVVGAEVSIAANNNDMINYEI